MSDIRTDRHNCYKFSNIRTYSHKDKFFIVMFEGDTEPPPPDMPIEEAYKYIRLDRDIVKVLTVVKE